jgi:cathepsin L
MDYINANNAQNNGMVLALNKFADLSSNEFARFYLGTRINVPAFEAPEETNNLALPTQFDWNAKGAVTPIKNQEQCGSCWSFSTTGSTEGCHQIKTNNLVALSEQNLMDCSYAEGNQGCDGGLMTAAMEYIILNKGIDTEASYPYTAEDGTSCQYTASNSGATLAGMVNVTEGSESDLQNNAAVGPVSVAIDASQSSFQFYSSGVYYEPACSSTQLDHGVLVTGWGVDNGAAYWIVKNSWGTDWGQNGWIWMSRNRNNNCGIATMATLPTC